VQTDIYCLHSGKMMDLCARCLVNRFRIAFGRGERERNGRACRMRDVPAANDAVGEYAKENGRSSPMVEHLVECTLGLSPLPCLRKVPVMNQKLLLTVN